MRLSEATSPTCSTHPSGIPLAPTATSTSTTHARRSKMSGFATQQLPTSNGVGPAATAGPSAQTLHLAKRLHAQRPGSVEADVATLSMLRDELSHVHQRQFDVADEEHRQRGLVDVEEDQEIKALLRDMKKSFLYVKYLDAQRDKERAQRSLTDKVHQLFQQSLAEAKAERDRIREAHLQEKHLHAEIARSRRRNRRLAEKQAEREEALRADVRAARIDDHHRRYALEMSRKLAAASRAVELKEEALTRRREQIVARALTMHDKRAHVARVREESASPTVFLRLPPMRDVFADDVLEFVPETLLSRHYQSTYQARSPSTGRRRASSVASSSSGTATRGTAPLRSSSVHHDGSDASTDVHECLRSGLRAVSACVGTDAND